MWKELDRDYIDAFKAQWPCHGLPEALDSLFCEFDTQGDLVDIEAAGPEGEFLDTTEFDGPALMALVADCKEVGDDTQT